MNPIEIPGGDQCGGDFPTSDAARVRELLVRQVSAPVRWEESVLEMAELGESALLKSARERFSPG